MHQVVMDEFERHLNGDASPAFYGHLDTCGNCRAEVRQMEELSLLLREGKQSPDSAVQPSLGFYNRVAGRIVEDRKSAGWGFFSPGAVFFRRVAFASLLLLAGLGSFLVTRESSAGGADAATIMAQHDVTSVHSESSDRDRLLVTLATYRQ